MPLHVELIEPEQGDFTVIVDGRFINRLCRDEALGVVAALLFSSRPPPRLRTYEEWVRWDTWLRHDKPPTVTALLTWHGSARNHERH